MLTSAKFVPWNSSVST